MPTPKTSPAASADVYEADIHTPRERTLPLLEITIDSREQTPWAFPSEYANVRIGTLRTGDYAITGDSGFAIERKNFDDFLGTISSGWKRFQREIYRAKDAGFSLPIIVEGRFSDVCFNTDETGNIIAPQHRHFNLTPLFVIHRIAELQTLGAFVLWYETAELANMIAFAMLKERWEELHSEDAQ